MLTSYQTKQAAPAISLLLASQSPDPSASLALVSACLLLLKVDSSTLEGHWQCEDRPIIWGGLSHLQSGRAAFGRYRLNGKRGLLDSHTLANGPDIFSYQSINFIGK